MTTVAARVTPYVGPRPFRTGEALYGRDGERQELLDLVIAERIVLVYSPSGAGKTSLLRAALIPALQDEGFRVLPVIRVNEPPDERLAVTAVNRYVFSALNSLEEGLAPSERIPVSELASMSLPEYLELRARTGDDASSLVLIFDQFEEILTVDSTDQAAKAAFFAQVGEALRDRKRLALFAMREDYVAGLDPYLRSIPNRFRTRYRIDLLGEHAARLAVKEPARAAGVDFTDAAAEALVDNLRRVRMQQPDGAIVDRLGPYVEPVQLQVVCLRLWANLQPEATQIVGSDIAALGDVDEALASFYAGSVHAIADRTAVPERVIREWFDRQLVTEQGIRRQVLREPRRSAGLENHVIGQLVDARLVRAEQRRGATWFELAHDRLIEPVRADNGVWFAAHLSPLQRQASLWDKEQRPERLLFRDKDLESAERWAAAQPDALPEREAQFLAASRAARTAARQEHRTRMSRMLAALAVGIALMLIIAVGVMLVLYDGTKEEILVGKAHRNLLINPESHISDLLNNLSSFPVRNRTGLEDALRASVQASRLQLELAHPPGEVTHVAFAPDGATLATGSKGITDFTVCVWDATSGQNKYEVPHKSHVSGVALTRTGSLITASWDGKVRLWEANPTRARMEESTIIERKDPVTAIALSRDGTKLAAATYSYDSISATLAVVELQSGRELRAANAHKDLVNSLAFSPNGEWLASGSADETAKVWAVQAATGLSEYQTFRHDAVVAAVAFAPNGQSILTGSAKGKVRIWAITLADAPLKVFDQSVSVLGVAFSPDGSLLATADEDGVIRLVGTDAVRELVTLRRSDARVNEIAFSPDGTKLATAGQDGRARIWDVSLQHADKVIDIAFKNNPEHLQLATASADSRAIIWNVEMRDNAPMVTRPQPEIVPSGSIFAADVSADGTLLATGGAGGAVRIWDAATGAPTLWRPHPSNEAVQAVVFSRDARWLATGTSNGMVRIVDTRSGESTDLDPDPSDITPVRSLAFSPDGRLLAGGSDLGNVTLWNRDETEAGKTLSDKDSWPRTSEATPLAHDAEKPVLGLAFSPDGKRLVSVSRDGTAKVWDTATGKRLSTLRGHERSVNAVAFSPDGKLIATAGSDGTVRLWEIRADGTAKLSHTFTYGAQTTSVAFSPDSRYLATGRADGRVHLEPLRIDELKALARQRIRHLPLENR